MAREHNPKSLKKALFIILIFMVPGMLFADLGPKPSVNVDIVGLETGRECWATLISETSTTGPASAWDGKEENAYYNEGQEEIWRAYTEYEDTDGYYFLQWIWDVSELHSFTWGYYPPENFKVLLYFPDTEEFRVSGILSRYAFDSYFDLDVDEMEVRRTYDWAGEMLSLILRIIITIAIELMIALLFGYRQKSQMTFLACVNIISQIMLNLALTLINYSYGAWTFFWWYLMLEFFVFALEAALYVFWLPKWSRGDMKKGKAIIYSLVANGVSFGAGFLIFQLVPGIF